MTTAAINNKITRNMTVMTSDGYTIHVNHALFLTSSAHKSVVLIESVAVCRLSPQMQIFNLYLFRVASDSCGKTRKRIKYAPIRRL
jgi:hypothetical protein